jgi:hypothetical protein
VEFNHHLLRIREMVLRGDKGHKAWMVLRGDKGHKALIPLITLGIHGLMLGSLKKTESRSN